MHAMLMQYCDAEPSDPAWASEASQVAQWLSEGGLSDVSVDRRAERVTLPPLTSFVPAHMKATPWAQAFGSLSPSKALAAVSDMQDHLSSWETATGLNVPFSSYLATAPA